MKKYHTSFLTKTIRGKSGDAKALNVSVQRSGNHVCQCDREEKLVFKELNCTLSLSSARNRAKTINVTVNPAKVHIQSCSPDWWWWWCDITQCTSPGSLLFIPSQSFSSLAYLHIPPSPHNPPQFAIYLSTSPAFIPPSPFRPPTLP